jgi:MoaA/NifB/PqqE/SkfB family radical SAM enzyme
MVRKKEDDIAKLWKMVRERDGHIDNFREMVADKDRIIGELQKVIAIKDRDLERLRLKDRRWEKGRLCLRAGAHRIREVARKVSNKARWR